MNAGGAGGEKPGGLRGAVIDPDREGGLGVVAGAGETGGEIGRERGAAALGDRLDLARGGDRHQAGNNRDGDPGGAGRDDEIEIAGVVVE